MTIRRRLGISATGACVALMFATVPAAAQTPSPSPSPSPGVGDNAAPSGQASVAIAIAVLVLGAIVLGVLYQYLNAWRKNIYTLTRRFVESTGSFPRYDHIAVDVETDPKQGLVHGEAPSASKLKINGPAQVHVGQPSDAFTLLLDDQPVVGTWTVDSGEAKLHPETGSNATLTATKEGPITLSAKHDGATAPASVVAVPMPEHGMLPFVGAGYGGITIAVLAVSVGGALTAINLLNGAALATLLGTVVAYFFVQRPAAGGSQQARTNGHIDAGI